MDKSYSLTVNLCVDPQDPQYMQQALTNALLMDAVVGSLQSSKAIYAASKLAHFDRIKTEGRTDSLTHSRCCGLSYVRWKKTTACLVLSLS